MRSPNDQQRRTRYPRPTAGAPKPPWRVRRRPSLRLFWLLPLIAAAAVGWYRSQAGPERAPLEQVPAGDETLAEDATPAPPESGGGPAEVLSGRVTRVGDGDTLTLRTDDGKQVKVRLYGLDAPELDQKYGPEARDFLNTLVLNRDVRVEQQTIDQYGRVVGLVFDSGLSLNLTLVASGQAWVYERYCRLPVCDRMRAEEAQARQKKLGLWRDDAPQPPWQWRKANGSRDRK